MSNLKNRFALFLCCCIVVLGIPATLWAQQSELEPPEPENLFERDLRKFDKQTPLSTAQGFMRAAESGDYQAASEFLDLRYLPKELESVDGAKLAEQFYIVLTRKFRIDFSSISDDPNGAQDDALPSYRDLAGEIISSSGKRQIFLQHIPGPGDSKIWKVSNATVAQIPELYAEFGYSPLVEHVRDVVPDGSLFGAEYFKWIISIGFAAAAALAWLLIAWPLGKILTRKNRDNTERVARYLTRPIPTAIFILVGGITLRDLGLGITATKFADSGTPATIVITWLLFSTVNLFRDLYANFLESRGRESGLMLLRPISSSAKVLIVLVALTIWLDKMGIEVTALVAGLGISGLAVALVLQKPLEDILGAVTLYTQQPVAVGQFCTSGDVTGTIDEISLRSTRVRKINNSVVIIPNSIFATASIENISIRRRILHQQTLRLSTKTTATQIRKVVDELSDVLRTNPDVLENEWRVRFFELGEFSMNLEVFAQINTTDWNRFLELSEIINLATLEVIDHVGVEIAVPPR